MTGISPGRAVYESLHAAIKRRAPFCDSVPWEALEPGPGLSAAVHEDWEAAAEAGHAAIEAADADDETPACWQVRAALATALETLQSVALSPHDDLAAMARKTLAGVEGRLGEPGQADLLSERTEARRAYRRVCEERDQLRTQVGAVYSERARLVAFLAACYESARATDWDDDEYEIVYVTTPAGQMSWHILADDAAGLLAHVPRSGVPEWDGHTTEVKYGRLADMTGRIAHAGGFAGLIASMAKPERTEPYPTAVERDELRDQRDEAREQLAGIKDRLENLAAGLEMSAQATRPSKKSSIEQGCADAVRGIAAAVSAAQEARTTGSGS